MAQYQQLSETPVMTDGMTVAGSTRSSPAEPAPSTSSPPGKGAGLSAQTAPAVITPHPLDGSQFHNVIEEQSWSELPPTPEEQMPRRALHREQRQDASSSHQEPPQISVGPV